MFAEIYVYINTGKLTVDIRRR